MVDVAIDQKSRDLHSAKPNGNFSVLITPDLLLVQHVTD